MLHSPKPSHALAQSTFMRDVLGTMTGNVGIMALGVVTGSMLARSLGPTGRGELAAAQIFGGLLSILAGLGIPEALTYEISRRPAEGRSILTSALCFHVPVLVIAISLGYWTLPFLLHAQSPPVIRYARQYLLIVIINLYAGSTASGFLALRRFSTWNTMRLVPVFCWLIVLTVAYFGGHFNLGFLIPANLIVTAVPIPFFLIALFKKLQGPIKPSWSSMKRLLRYGFPIVLIGVPGTVNLRADQLLMATFLSPYAIGLYVTAVAWSGAVTSFIGATGDALLPRLAALNNGASGQEHKLGVGIRSSVLLAGMLVIAGLATTPILLPLLFGSPFRAAVPVALVLVFAAGVFGVNSVLAACLKGLGKPTYVLYAQIAGAVSTVLLLAILLKPFQLMGAAVASAASYSVVLLTLFCLLRRTSSMSLKELALPRSNDVSLIWREGRRFFRRAHTVG